MREKPAEIMNAVIHKNEWKNMKEKTATHAHTHTRVNIAQQTETKADLKMKVHAGFHLMPFKFLFSLRRIKFGIKISRVYARSDRALSMRVGGLVLVVSNQI